MGLSRIFAQSDFHAAGAGMHRLAADLYPICRSITGRGVRQSLQKLQSRIPIQIREVPSGTQVFDWTVPKEWNIRQAYLEDASGNRVVDFEKSNLHVLNYSTPIDARVSLAELRPHLFTIPEHPEWIPYRTSYYKENWGFCLSNRQLEDLPEGIYHAYIDSSLADGHLTYGEYFLAGGSSEEVLISAHICHPSLANDNLSGLAVATFLAAFLGQQKLRYSYRFLFAPGTIGAITWLALNKEGAKRIRHGLILTCVGDAGGFHYKRSRRHNAAIDRAAAHILRYCGEPAETLDFSPYGYDERQYCSPGFDLPVGCLMRSVWGQFPQYHSSADNLEFIYPEKLLGSLRVCLSILDVLENDRCYRNESPWCEPQLGKRNLYRTTGGVGVETGNMARLWVLNQSDGQHSLLDIAERAGIPFPVILDAAEVLTEGGLLSPLSESAPAI